MILLLEPSTVPIPGKIPAMAGQREFDARPQDEELF